MQSAEIEKQFYKKLYHFYAKLRTCKKYYHPINAAYMVLVYLDEHKSELQNVDKLDIRNLLLLSKVLLNEEQRHKREEILRNEDRITRIREYTKELAYLAK